MPDDQGIFAPEARPRTGGKKILSRVFESTLEKAADAADDDKPVSRSKFSAAALGAVSHPCSTFSADQ